MGGVGQIDRPAELGQPHTDPVGIELGDDAARLPRGEGTLELTEQRWFDKFWPACNPARPDRESGHPEPEALSRWARTPLLESLHPAE